MPADPEPDSTRSSALSDLPNDDPPDLDLQELETLEEPDPNPEPVSYSGTDFDVEGLVRRLNRGDIVIPTFGSTDNHIETAGFQRRFVWRRPQMDRFVESLLLGYPIPGIMLVQQLDKRYLVLDGQQRLRTMAAYYRGVHDGKEFSLQNVAPRFRTLTYETLDTELRRVLDNTFIQATIVKTDGSPQSLDSIYQVFERLNSGGTQLTPHEIRVALYAGPFIELLTQLNTQADWRTLYGSYSPRLRDQEIVLRSLALYVSPGDYRRPLKKYLNDFVALHRNVDALDAGLLVNRFSRATHLLLIGPGPGALRGKGRQVNAALTEAILVGLMRRLDAGTEPSPDDVRDALADLVARPELDAAISRATADEESVRTRIGAATSAFAGR